MAVIDFDAIFEKFMRLYMKKNSGKYSADEWEEVVVKKYEKFGRTAVPSIGVSPSDYYNAMSGKQLADTLKEHVESRVSVPDFLCQAIVKSGCEEDIIPLIDSGAAELKAYAVNLLSDMNSTKPLLKYLDLMADEKTDGDLLEIMTDALKENANLVKESALACYAKYPKTQKYLIEVLCRCSRDDRIFVILSEAFLSNTDNIPLYCSYIAAYGDENALPLLLGEIQREDICYADFNELKFAIEALGGEYEQERVFSDKSFKKVKQAAEELNN